MTSETGRTRNFVAACHAGRGERTTYAIIAVVMLAFSAALFVDSIFMGVITGGIALAAVAMAVTGFCPSGWLFNRHQSDGPDDILGIPYARGVLTLDELDD